MTKKQISAAMAEIGRMGGVKATGAKKRRSPEHYASMVRARLAKKNMRK